MIDIEIEGEKIEHISLQGRFKLLSREAMPPRDTATIDSNFPNRHLGNDSSNGCLGVFANSVVYMVLVSQISLYFTGGGNPKPGEISLAHHGVLFLDELPEFSRAVLEVLREPLESGRITISRAARQADFPAQFQLIAAMNPCPCGYLGHANGKCRCTPDQVARYRGKISGPLMDRIDIQIEVPALLHADLTAPAQGESSSSIQLRVERAYQRQLTRQGKANSQLTTKEIDRLCSTDVNSNAKCERDLQKH